MDIATELDVDVSHFGGDCRLYQLDKPFEGADHIVVCDRTPLANLDLPGMAGFVDSTIDCAIEVFATDEAGTYVGDSLVPLRRMVSLRRYSDGVNFSETLSGLGYKTGGQDAR